MNSRRANTVQCPTWKVRHIGAKTPNFTSGLIGTELLGTNKEQDGGKEPQGKVNSKGGRKEESKFWAFEWNDSISTENKALN